MLSSDYFTLDSVDNFSHLFPLYMFLKCDVVTVKTKSKFIASDIHRIHFNYVSLNCGGLNAKYDYIKLLIEKFSATDHPIQEWLYKKVGFRMKQI